ncbi:MAG: CBS domain-containing protein [Clostridia bacterium]|nr:CBS domain-containing protein [Clostridia bacterium]
MKVKECMCTNVACVNPNTTVCDVAKLMLDKHVGCIPVCNEKNNVVGLVTDRDLILRTLACEKDVKQTPVSEVMTTKVFNITPNAEVAEAEKIMCECQVRRVPVVENDILVGIITIGDLANNQNVSHNEVSNTVEKICKCGENSKNSE